MPLKRRFETSLAWPVCDYQLYRVPASEALKSAEGACVEVKQALNIMGYKIFDLLPFVLLDNAIKYSPKDKDIRVTFLEKDNSLSVTIMSYGPPLLAGEEQFVFEETFRGENVKNTTEGSGIGLSLAKKICDIHDISIMILWQRPCSLPEAPIC